MNQIKRAVNFLGVSRLVVIGFLLLLIVSVFPLGINPGMIYSDCLVRIGMNGFLVLAMMVSIVCGAGLNFGLPIGILCGLLRLFCCLTAGGCLTRTGGCIPGLGGGGGRVPLQYSLTGAAWPGSGAHVSYPSPLPLLRVTFMRCC